MCFFKWVCKYTAGNRLRSGSLRSAVDERCVRFVGQAAGLVVRQTRSATHTFILRLSSCVKFQFSVFILHGCGPALLLTSPPVTTPSLYQELISLLHSLSLSITHHQPSSTIITLHHSSSVSINLHKSPSTSINHHYSPSLSSLFINLHQIQSTSISLYQPPSTSIKLHQT